MTAAVRKQAAHIKLPSIFQLSQDPLVDKVCFFVTEEQRAQRSIPVLFLITANFNCLIKPHNYERDQFCNRVVKTGTGLVSVADKHFLMAPGWIYALCWHLKVNHGACWTSVIN
jgi:hypothetical protein